MSSFSFKDVLAAAKETGGLEGGIYELEFLRGQPGTTKAGAASYGINWRVVSGPDKGRRTWDNYYASDNNISFSILSANLRALGLSEEDMTGGTSNDEVNDRLSGTIATVEVSITHGSRGGIFTTYRVLDVTSQLTDSPATGNDFLFNN